VHRDVVADPHDEALALILDQEIGVGDAAFERLGLDRRRPAAERPDAL
jgi:hypothetical protein